MNVETMKGLVICFLIALQTKKEAKEKKNHSREKKLEEMLGDVGS